MRRLAQIAKYVWASPCSLVGVIFACMVILFGGRISRSSGTLEVAYREYQPLANTPARRLPFRAITFGHVIIAITRQELELLRAHERIHVQQYEHWGIAFFAAYAGSSIWQLLMGRNAYWDNWFEVEARLRTEKKNGTDRSA
ncbi:MAG: signal peptide prediction [Burkholderiaceae bacterium]